MNEDYYEDDNAYESGDPFDGVTYLDLMDDLILKLRAGQHLTIEETEMLADRYGRGPASDMILLWTGQLRPGRPAPRRRGFWGWFAPRPIHETPEVLSPGMARLVMRGQRIAQGDIDDLVPDIDDVGRVARRMSRHALARMEREIRRQSRRRRMRRMP